MVCTPLLRELGCAPSMSEVSVGFKKCLLCVEWKAPRRLVSATAPWMSATSRDPGNAFEREGRRLGELPGIAPIVIGLPSSSLTT